MTTPTLTSDETNLLEAVRHWNAGDLDGYLALYDPTITLHGYTPEPMDKTAVRGFYSTIFAAFPGCTLTLHETIPAGDRVTARFTLTGRHDGPFLGVPATGREIALPGITVLRFVNGSCVERWSCADMLAVLVQIGAVPAPA
jgi:predicted ester cyclase